MRRGCRVNAAWRAAAVEISNEPAVSALGVTAEGDGWGQLIVAVGDIHTAESFPDSLAWKEQRPAALEARALLAGGRPIDAPSGLLRRTRATCQRDRSRERRAIAIRSPDSSRCDGDRCAASEQMRRIERQLRHRRYGGGYGHLGIASEPHTAERW